MWIPDWLYERLPALYVAIGLMCLWLLGASFWAGLSALMFFTAAMLTFGKRRNARAEPEPQEQGRRTGLARR